jgi:hypothetical protein
MKLQHIVNEKLGAFVFTKESIKMLSVTLRTNKLILDQFPAGDKEYYVLRTSSSRKDLVEPSEKAVAIIQLNGDRLNGEIKKKNVQRYLNDKNKSLGNDLYSDERIIPDAVRFIEQVSVLIADEKILPTSELKEIEAMCKEMNIPLFFYNNIKDFTNNNRQNKVSLGTPDYNYKRQHYSGIPESVKAFFYFSRKDDLSKVPEKYAKFVNEFVLDQKRPSFINRLKQDLKGIEKNPLGKELVTKIFQTADTDNIERIVKDMADKWKAIINKHNKKQPK